MSYKRGQPERTARTSMMGNSVRICSSLSSNACCVNLTLRM